MAETSKPREAIFRIGDYVEVLSSRICGYTDKYLQSELRQALAKIGKKP